MSSIDCSILTPAPPLSRFSYPFVDALAECPNGSVYAVGAPDGFSKGSLWRVDPSTATLTRIGSLQSTSFLGPTALACDGGNELFGGSDDFSIGAGVLFRINTQTAEATIIGPDVPGYRALASGPRGILYAIVTEDLAVATRVQLVTVSTTSGLQTPVNPGHYLTSREYRGMA